MMPDQKRWAHRSQQGGAHDGLRGMLEPGRTGTRAEGGEETARFPEEEAIQPDRAEGDPETIDEALRQQTARRETGDARRLMSEPSRASRNAAVAAAGIGLGLGLAGRELFRRLREADLRGQVALITGGSRGLGLAMAREFAREGCRLVICARDEEELARAREELEQQGATVRAVRCDVAERGEVDDLVEAATRSFGRVDLLINNAGAIEVGPVQTMTVPDYEKAMGVMFWGTVYPTLAVLPQMLERRGGRIVNITSIGGKVSVPHLLPYNCAKFAAVGFSEGLRAELMREKIIVTTIVPGLMRTGGYLNAEFKGRQESEFTWFSLSSNLPLISMSAERAARQIVRATRRGDAECILSLPASLLARFHGVCPSTTINLLGLVNRFVLPGADGAEKATTRGQELQERVSSPVLETLTGLGRSAGRQFHQYNGRSETRERKGRPAESS